MASSIQADTPLAAQLTELVQPKLVELGWETGSGDDNALAEYITLMLVNGKTQEQISSELSNDLLSLGPDDPVASEFSRWLFEQVAILTNQGPQGPAPVVNQMAGAPIESVAQDDHSHGDADMGEAMDGISADGGIPTGPKSMRNNPRGGRRMLGHLNKAMDRSTDAALHRIKGQGSGRINMHGNVPRGPRAANGGPGRGVPTGPARGGRGGHLGRGGMGGNFGGNMGIPAQQQMQLMNLWEQQAKIMSSILTPQQQQMMGGMNAPAINPAFQQRQGKSLMDRVNKPNGHFGGRQHHNAGSSNNAEGDDMTMDMGESKSELGPDTVCKFNLKCTKPDCIFAHQSPAAPPGTTIDPQDVCTYGAACQNRKCVGRHPSPAQKKAHAAETECRFFPNCTNPNCPFQHPNMPLCRNGADCTQEGCKFTHLKTMCKYNPCMNPKCPYKHEEGQRKRTFGDMQWRAGDADKAHVSERKFVVDAEDEEVVIPGGEGGAEAGSSGDVEIAT